MNGYELYTLFSALKLHFTSPTYDFFKYNGKSRVSVDAFERRKDKFLFHKLARQLEEVNATHFIVSVLSLNRKAFVRNLLAPEAKETYRAWKERYDTLYDIFERDMTYIKSEFDRQDLGIPTLFRIPESGYPLLWTMMNRGEISVETICILNWISGMLNLWDKKFKGDYIYEGNSMLIRKYAPFLDIDEARVRSIVKRYLTS